MVEGPFDDVAAPVGDRVEVDGAPAGGAASAAVTDLVGPAEVGSVSVRRSGSEVWPTPPGGSGRARSGSVRRRHRESVGWVGTRWRMCLSRLLMVLGRLMIRSAIKRFSGHGQVGSRR